MSRCLNVVGVCAAIIIAVGLTAMSSAPHLLSYQGRVTASGASPVPDGSYPAVFAFFDSPTLGMVLWTEAGNITTSSGLFTHKLGSISPIPSGLFPNNSVVYLEVSVNGQVQSPRTRITSAGYALMVNTVEGAAGGQISGDVGVSGILNSPDMRSGSPLQNGALSIYQNGALAETARLRASAPHGGALDLLDESLGFTSFLQPDVDGSGGYFALFGGASGGFYIDGNSPPTGTPFVSLSGSGSSVIMNTTVGSNASIILPDSAISAQEVLDESGIASNISASAFSLTTSMQDLLTVTITTPAPGYIRLTGKVAELDLWNTTGNNWVFVQIDETAGGSSSVPYFGVYGGAAFPTTGFYFYAPYVERTYYKPVAGTYTFRLEAMKMTSAPASATAYFPALTAAYHPTSYGPVAAIAEGDESGQFERVSAVQAPSTSPAPGVRSSTAYLVDLRELELKAAKAEIEAQKASRELAEARLKRQTQKDLTGQK